MKILVFSDSHGIRRHMEEAVRLHQPDRIFHLGDVVSDAKALKETFPHIPMDLVRGNCDGHLPEPEELLLEVEGRKILLCHGHTYHVKWDWAEAAMAARAARAHILLFGHTHEPMCTFERGLWIMNPGSIRGGWNAGYGVIVLEEGNTVCYTVPVR